MADELVHKGPYMRKLKCRESLIKYEALAHI